MNALEIHGLHKVYKGKKGKLVEALQGLDLLIPVGEVFGFLGPNGAGKSTTIKAVMGLIRASAGTAYINGISVDDPSSRLKVGYLPENPSFYDFLTGREYLHFVGRAFAISDTIITAETEKVLDLMELRASADRPIRGYSKGMVQRLGLAQALVHDPDIYILDEPMSGLDPLGRALVKNIIRSLKNSGKTVFFSTHITSDVEVVCDRVGVIVGGKLRVVDRVENILHSGIEGYSIQITGLRSGMDIFSGFDLEKKNTETSQLFVPRDRMKEFMDLFSKSGGEIELIEPKRKDVEAFFLDIVAKSGV